MFLARAQVPLGGRVALLTDDLCAPALDAGLAACDLQRDVPVVVLPRAALTPDEYGRRVQEQLPFGPLTHLLAIERVGPSHTLDAIPPAHRDRCHTMRGRDVTDHMSPAHYLFEAAHAAQARLVTIVYRRWRQPRSAWARFPVGRDSP